MASADFPSALTEELSPGKALILSLHTVRLYFVRLVWISGFTVASTLTARTRPLCRFVFLRSKVCFPLPSAWPRGLRPTTSALRFPTVTSIGPGRIVSSCENQPMPGTLAHASACRVANHGDICPRAGALVPLAFVATRCNANLAVLRTSIEMWKLENASSLLRL